MMKIVVVGVGALGSNLILIARNLKVDWKIVDFDKVESKNTMSQFHTKMSLGKAKTVALQQTMSGLFGVKMESIPHKLTHDNMNQLLGGADLIVDCLDNGASRRLVQSYARTHNVPCLHGALAPNGQFGRVVWDAHFQIDDETGQGQATCEDGAHLPFIMMVASHMAEAIKQYMDKNVCQGAEIHPHGFIRT